MRYSILKYLFIFCLSIALYACNMESNDILVPAKQLIERQIGIRANEITCQVIEPVNGKCVSYLPEGGLPCYEDLEWRTYRAT